MRYLWRALSDSAGIEHGTCELPPSGDSGAPFVDPFRDAGADGGRDLSIEFRRPDDFGKLHGGYQCVVARRQGSAGGCSGFIDNVAGQFALMKGYGTDLTDGILAFWGLAADRGWSPDFRRGHAGVLRGGERH